MVKVVSVRLLHCRAAIFPFSDSIGEKQSLSSAYLKGNGIKLLFPEGRVSKKMVKANIVINNISEEIL